MLNVLQIFFLLQENLIDFFFIIRSITSGLSCDLAAVKCSHQQMEGKHQDPVDIKVMKKKTHTQMQYKYYYALFCIFKVLKIRIVVDKTSM